MIVKSKHVKREKEDTCFLFSCFFIFCKLFEDAQEFFPSLFFFFAFYGCYLLPFFYEQRALHFTSPPFPFLLSFLLFVQNVSFVRSNPFLLFFFFSLPAKKGNDQERVPASTAMKTKHSLSAKAKAIAGERRRPLYYEGREVSLARSSLRTGS